MKKRCIGTWSYLLLSSFLLYTKHKCSVNRPRGRAAESCWAVPSKNNHIFLILSGPSGVAGLHVSCTCVPVYFSLCSRDQHTQLSSGWDHGFIFKSWALWHNFPFVCFVLPCMGDLQARAQPSPREIASLLLGQGLGRASGELLKERIVSLENGAPLGTFFS